MAPTLFARVLQAVGLPLGPAGAWGERVAARYLRRRGLRIVERNARMRGGELDLVALEGRTLVFVEVKTSSAASRAAGFDRIDERKRRRLRRAALAWIARRRPEVEGWRVDAVEVRFEASFLGGRRAIELRWHQAIVDLDG